jgi:hypothetical protein
MGENRQINPAEGFEINYEDIPLLKKERKPHHSQNMEDFQRVKYGRRD